mgnify:CR=1 FL=1
MKSKRSGRKVRVSRTGTRLVFLALLTLGCMSCSTAQKISVKQSQGDQVQETTIEHNGKVDNLSLSFINTPNVWTL